MVAGVLGSAIVELAPQPRPAAFETPHDVAAERAVFLEELLGPALALEPARATALPHERADERERFDRPDERVPLEELSLVPQEAVELARVERPEAAPQDEMLRLRDRGDRVELEEAEAANGVEHATRGAVEELRAHGDAARLFDRDRSLRPRLLHGRIVGRAARHTPVTVADTRHDPSGRRDQRLHSTGFTLALHRRDTHVTVADTRHDPSGRGRPSQSWARSRR